MTNRKSPEQKTPPNEGYLTVRVERDLISRFRAAVKERELDVSKAIRLHMKEVVADAAEREAA